ncbi:Fra1p [Sugiyamaella lignohabitans]|uniref:Fra1p n=1 Tax=Sugiyamaella lignohabitans TaxID=796027 RepID=A0A161HGZ6_9ASCO|nr:Fra1p [Sugiyamaella lignohabitans]ANB11197.1 Fra1p [Sugiyamaella lignohabitans]
MVDTSARLSALRSQLSKNNIGYYIVLTQDEHQSEYTSNADDRREFISGFTGSAGTAVIGHSKAVLATDGRYFLQAASQLDSNWELLKQGVKGVPTWQEWVATEATKTGSNIAVDPKLISYSEVKSLKSLLATKGGKAELISLEDNLIDLVWANDRPSRPLTPVKILHSEYTGKSFQEKLTQLKDEIIKKNGTAFVLSALDDVAWLFNLRGEDIPYNPVFFAYAIVTADGKASLYIDSNKVTEKVAEYLKSGNVSIYPYEKAFEDAAELGAALLRINKSTSGEKKKLIIPNAASWALVEALGGPDSVQMIESPVTVAKSVKNSTEVEGAKLAHIKDGVAVIRYLAWLEKALTVDKLVLSDYEAAQKSLEFRSQMENFQGLSFETISSSGPKAAVIHYSPATDSKEIVKLDQIYLLDSGGQYLEGTTDTTRTVHYGEPSDDEKRSYTLVLKGHIALARAVFPEGSNGYMLDTLARQHLWKYGLDYRHGTGHGIGAFLNVHEGPMGIGFRPAYQNAPLQVGNVISNEPGYYEDGKYGIRIESVVVVKEVKTPFNFGDTKFFGFETITQVPLCQKLLDLSLLDVEEKQWINEYHASVYKTVRPYFSEEDPALEWLRRETLPIF